MGSLHDMIFRDKIQFFRSLSITWDVQNNRNKGLLVQVWIVRLTGGLSVLVEFAFYDQRNCLRIEGKFTKVAKHQ